MDHLHHLHHFYGLDHLWMVDQAGPSGKGGKGGDHSEPYDKCLGRTYNDCITANRCLPGRYGRICRNKCRELAKGICGKRVGVARLTTPRWI
jgi:hypothetical protein